MTLYDRFARLVRQVLTPYRKKIIIDRVLTRIKKSAIRDKLSIYKLKVYPNKNKFGVFIAICESDYEIGYILRCGCYTIGKIQSLAAAKAYHKDTTDHGRLIDRPSTNNDLVSGIYPTGLDFTPAIKLPKRIGNFRGTPTSPKPNAIPKAILGRPRKKTVEE